jgi:plastocyanin
MKKSFGTRNSLFAASALLVAILFNSSCSKSSNDYGSSTMNPNATAAGPGVNEVFIQGMAFTPATITVKAGTTITWTNKDGYAHTVTSDTQLFDSGSVKSNGTFSYTFATAGTFPYHCTIHTSMTAKVVVN